MLNTLPLIWCISCFTEVEQEVDDVSDKKKINIEKESKINLFSNSHMTKTTLFSFDSVTIKNARQFVHSM